MKFINTAKNVVLWVLFGIILILLAVVGYKSKKLKQFAIDLLKARSQLKLNELNNKANKLKEESRKIDEERTNKLNAYHEYVAKLNDKG